MGNAGRTGCPASRVCLRALSRCRDHFLLKWVRGPSVGLADGRPWRSASTGSWKKGTEPSMASLFTSSSAPRSFAGAVVSRLAGVVSWRFVGKQPASLLMPSSKIEEIFEFSGGDCSVSVTPAGGVTGVYNVTLSAEGSVT